MNLSFDSCGFLGIYHIGVASCFQLYAPHVFLNKISGGSTGSCVALSLLLGKSIGELASKILAACYHARQGVLGPFSPYFDPNVWLRDWLEVVLPHDAHIQLSGRLHVYLTRVYDGKNILVNHFSSREEVIQVVLSSCFIPVFSGFVPPRYQGSRVIDSGNSGNILVLDKETITVSPFSGCADICPKKDHLKSALLVNNSNTCVELSKDTFAQMIGALSPPSPELLARYCKQGFDDALRFLQSRHMVKCTRSMGVASSFQLEEELPDNCDEYDPVSGECIQEKQEGDKENASISLVEVFEKYIEKFDQRYGKLIQENEVSKMLICLAMVILQCIMWLMFHFFPNASSVVANWLDQVLKILFCDNIDSPLTSYKARYYCRFTISQHGQDSINELVKNTPHEKDESVKDILNIGLVSCLNGDKHLKLPESQEEVKKFQKENCLNDFKKSAVAFHVGSSCTSRRGSCAVSTIGSRVGSEESLYDLDVNLPNSLEHIKEITENHESIIQFYYNVSSSQLNVMEIFDVTQLDPFLLMEDNFDCTLETLSLKSSIESSSEKPESEASSFWKHQSIDAIVPNDVKCHVKDIKETMMNSLACYQPQKENFLDYSEDEITGSDQSFSDPELEEHTDHSIHSKELPEVLSGIKKYFYLPNLYA